MHLRYCLPRVKRRGYGLGNELVPWARAFLAAQSSGPAAPPAFGMNRRRYWWHFHTAPDDWIYHRAIEHLLPVVELWRPITGSTAAAMSSRHCAASPRRASSRADAPSCWSRRALGRLLSCRGRARIHPLDALSEPLCSVESTAPARADRCWQAAGGHACTSRGLPAVR